MRVFIVRPFGPRNGIDFDRVQRELIDPALKDRGFAGDTTQQFVEAGNIRVDMFEQLLLADVVIADISVHNANVFYELGIRHALRGKHTVLIRAKISKPREERTAEDEVPFDLKTDRYLVYDHTKPEDSVAELIRAITFATDARNDSPVFQSLPGLVEQDRARFLPVPTEFGEAVDSARARKDLATLGLLAAEARGFTWEVEGWRKVGQVLFDLHAMPAAKRAWERIRGVDAFDVQANLKLGTIFQRSGDVTASEQALERVVNHTATTRRDKAEAWALRGSNAKVAWAQGWERADAIPKRQELALRSPFLDEAYRAYRAAFDLDLNHYYPGLNALALLSIRLDLIEQLPEIWSESFAKPIAAELERSNLEDERDALKGAVRMALAAADQTDPWIVISLADYEFLTAAKATLVKVAYQKSLAYPKIFNSRSAKRQIELFAALGLKADRAALCLAEFPDIPAPSNHQHVVVFTGHRVDQPGRSTARFPDTMSDRARDAIRTELAKLRPSIGIAAAASGGDILFHQVCRELSIPSRIRLCIPARTFVQQSVAPSGSRWVDEYWALLDATGQPDLVELSAEEKLPSWLAKKPDYNIWRRGNWWQIEEALSLEPQRFTVLALWNGEVGDGPGGTKDFLDRAQALGATPCVIDTKTLFT